MTNNGNEELYRGIIDIDNKYIEEAQKTRRNRKRPMWIRYSAIAACLCFVAVSAITMFHSGTIEDKDRYRMSLYQSPAQGQDAFEIYTLSYTDNNADIAYPVTLSDGTTIPAVFVAASSDTKSTNRMDMELAEAESFAYMDLDSASDELREKILAAREAIIYSQSWVADGFSCYITSPDGTKKTVPTFSELFPDWEIPTVDTDETTVTPDGLGSSGLYGIFVEISEIDSDHMMCRTTTSFAPFEAGQDLCVYFPANFDASCIEEGKMMMISFYGKDCDRASGILYAQEISEQP